jgi:hypothetical protein
LASLKRSVESPISEIVRHLAVGLEDHRILEIADVRIAPAGECDRADVGLLAG